MEINSTIASMESSVANLLTTTSATPIPHGADFHFYNNFDAFSSPVSSTDTTSRHLLTLLGASSPSWSRTELTFIDNYHDLDVEAYAWLVNVNDEILDTVDANILEFGERRRKEAEIVEGSLGKRKERESDVKVGSRVKPKIPFHIASLRKPQEEFKIVVNNKNQPFEHAWMEKGSDGRRVHPLEKFSPSDFVDGDETKIVPVEPPPLECTPFKLIEEVKDLKALAAKLRKVDEFAVDLEHNQYRSFQGLTCLMQLSTRSEDYVIDTLKLKVHIGPYLREFFKDPTKRKVLHGADHDVLWLQRDFGIYICNMFDTGQASRVMKLERFSLEYLLDHFCGVKANKEYQNADWRIRPLPAVMLRYAREDTHYLLYIYDLMRIRLKSLDADTEFPGTLLGEVYNRSYHICMSRYEKELLTDQSFRSIYGLRGAGLSAQQLAVVAGLCEWRDVVARTEDESTGFILPNRTLVEIAKEMPLTTSKLRRFVRSKQSYVERNLASVVNIIRCSMKNSADFVAAAEELKQLPKVEPRSEHKSETVENPEVLSELDNVSPGTLDSPDENKKSEIDVHRASTLKDAVTIHEGSKLILPTTARASVEVLKKPSRSFGALLGNSLKRKFQSDKTEVEHIKSAVSLPFHNFTTRNKPAAEELELQFKPAYTEEPRPPMEEPASHLEEPASLLEELAPLCEEHAITLDVPASTVILSHAEESAPAAKEPDSLMVYSLCEEPQCAAPLKVPVYEKPATEVPALESKSSICEEHVAATNFKLEDVILLDSDEEPSLNDIPMLAEEAMVQMEDNGAASSEEFDEEDDAMSLSHLASNFQECFQSIKDTRKGS